VKLDDSIKNEWKEQMLRYNTTMERWSILQQKRKEAHSKKYRDRLFIERIKIAVTYPRIDIKVTEGFNHLLKAPFSVHPKTGKGEFSFPWPRQPVYKKQARRQVLWLKI
jgi:DNA primase small subunit